MPTYDYVCPSERDHEDVYKRHTRVVSIAERDNQNCEYCGAWLERQVSAPLFKIQGKITKGGGPDKFTADMLGIPLKELPEGLKT